MFGSIILLVLILAPDVDPNVLYDDWPQHCCRLQTKEMKYGDQLPKDYVLAGISNNERFAYVVDGLFEQAIKLKSERWNRYPIYGVEGCQDDTSSESFHILVNTNKCAIEWYTTRYNNESFPNPSGHVLNNDRSFAPAYNKLFFARMNNSDMAPAYQKNGKFEGCKVGKSSIKSISSYDEGHSILTIDCLNSLVTMTDAKLVNISYPNSETPTDKTDMTYFHRTFKNDSPAPQKQKVGFSVERTNLIRISLSESFASSRCDDQSNTFTDAFGAKASSEVSAGIGPFSAKLGLEVSASFEETTASAFRVCYDKGTNRTSDNSKKETIKYKFSDQVTVPANSLTSVRAYTIPFRGKFDYRMTYKLSPRFQANNQTRDIVLSGLKFFKLSDELDFNGTDIFVHFDSKLYVDSGYEVSVDVVSIPLNGSKAMEVSPQASYNLLPEGEY